VIPKRHALGYSELGRPELNACYRHLEQEKRTIEWEDAGVGGFNVVSTTARPPGRSSSTATPT
jgi:hypothetical protein